MNFELTDEQTMLREAAIDRWLRSLTPDERAALRARQKQGRLAGDLDTELLLILMVGLSVTPTAFPQVVRLVTGGPASAPSFQRRWRAFLNRFAERLLPCSSPE